MNIFLIGYMGSGKSSIGRILAEVLKFDFIDYDDYIQEKTSNTISEIFKSKGEIYFRKIESKYLDDLLNNKKQSVISLGGGTPCYGDNMDRILNSKASKTIYIKASIKTLSDRLFEEKSHRPLVAHLETKEELLEFIGKHLFERSYYYNKSDLIVNTDNKRIDEVVESILLELF